MNCCETETFIYTVYKNFLSPKINLEEVKVDEFRRVAFTPVYVAVLNKSEYLLHWKCLNKQGQKMQQKFVLNQGQRSRLKAGVAERSKEKQSYVVALYKKLQVWGAL